MIKSMPRIFDNNNKRNLSQMWAFKYESKCPGIDIHADFAAINVNFWVTPDEANLNPESGGLLVWDKSAPPDWNFKKLNSDVKAIKDFLSSNHSKPVCFPYRANRAVIFNSQLFHKTDQIQFKPGYENRRLNVTMLYGDRIMRVKAP